MACHCLLYWINKENHEENFHRPIYLVYDVLKRIRGYYKSDKVNTYIMSHRVSVLIGWKPPTEG